jgi:hypothetical protein
MSVCPCKEAGSTSTIALAPMVWQDQDVEYKTAVDAKAAGSADHGRGCSAPTRTFVVGATGVLYLRLLTGNTRRQESGNTRHKPLCPKRTLDGANDAVRSFTHAA